MRGAIRRQAARPTSRSRRSSDGGTSSAPPKTPSAALARRVHGHAGTRPQHRAAPRRRHRPPAPRPSTMEHQPITTISSHSRARTPASGPSPAIRQSPASLRKSRARCAARKRRHREQGDGEPFTPRETRSYEVALRARPLAPGLSPRLASRTHSVGTMANTSVARHSRRSLAPLLPSPVVSRRDRRGSRARPVAGLFRNVLPRALLTDNGSAMLAAETVEGLSAGVVHHTTLPYSPEQNGKQESFWGQIEGRLLPMLEGEPALTLDLLNTATQAWVEQEYQRKVHSGVRESPLDWYLRGPSVGRESPGSDALRRALRTEVSRKQRRSDGTVTVDGVRFEVPAAYRTSCNCDCASPDGTPPASISSTHAPAITWSRFCRSTRPAMPSASPRRRSRRSRGAHSPRRHRAALACPHGRIRRHRFASRLLAKTRPRRRSHRGLMTKLLSLYGLKFHPFRPDVPPDALFTTPPSTASSDASSSELPTAVSAMITGDPGTGKSIALRVLSERLRALPDVLPAPSSIPRVAPWISIAASATLFAVPSRPITVGPASRRFGCDGPIISARAVAAPCSSSTKPKKPSPRALELRILASKELDSKQLLLCRLRRRCATPRETSLAGAATPRLPDSQAAQSRLRLARRASGLPRSSPHRRGQLAWRPASCASPRRSRRRQLPRAHESRRRAARRRRRPRTRKARRKASRSSLPRPPNPSRRGRTQTMTRQQLHRLLVAPESLVVDLADAALLALEGPSGSRTSSTVVDPAADDPEVRRRARHLAACSTTPAPATRLPSRPRQLREAQADDWPF